MVRLEWTDRSIEDLREIKDYIDRDSGAYAKIFINKLYDSAQKLIEFPKIGRIVPELNNTLIRELIFQNYRIVYRIVDDLIEIITVFHGSRLLRL